MFILQFLQEARAAPVEKTISPSSAMAYVTEVLGLLRVREAEGQAFRRHATFHRLSPPFWPSSPEQGRVCTCGRLPEPPEGMKALSRGAPPLVTRYITETRCGDWYAFSGLNQGVDSELIEEQILHEQRCCCTS